MTSILIDYRRIITNHLPIFRHLSIPPTPLPDFEIGLVLVIEPKHRDRLNSLPYGSRRLAFMNQKSFINAMINHYYVLYNPKRSICILYPDYGMDFPLVIQSLHVLPSHTMLWVGISINDQRFTDVLIQLIQNGFHSAYITNMNPAYEKISDQLALVRTLDDGHRISIRKSISQILYALREYNKYHNTCSLLAKFSTKSINILKSTTLGGIQDHNGKLSQRELTGEIQIENIVAIRRRSRIELVYVMSVDVRTIQAGGEENVDVSPTRYNFHSHPYAAYVRHQVEKAWPSITDYLGYLKLGSRTIFHCVTTLEGLYILSFGSYWGKKINEIDSDFINQHYDIDHTEPYSPIEYINKINSIRYKGYSIFVIQFLPWEQADSVFKVNYSTVCGVSCLPSKEQLLNFEKIYYKH